MKRILFSTLFICLIAILNFNISLADEDVKVDFEDEDVVSMSGFNPFDSEPAYEKNVPTMQLFGGQTSFFYHEDAFKGELADENTFDLRLGATTVRKLRADSTVVSYEFNSAMISNTLADWSGLDDSSEGIRSNTWRFGFFNSTGYGYKLGEYTDIVLTHGGGLYLSDIEFLDDAKDSLDQDALNVLEGDLRLGQNFEAGIKIRLTKNIAIDAAYEQSQTLPRFLFWKAAWSGIIEAAGHGLVSVFVNAVAKSSPGFTPIMDFLLHNGLSYGMYELRKDDMNWPAKGVPPFVYESFKVGITLMM